MQDLYKILKEPFLTTLYLTFVPLLFSVFFGFMIGIIIFVTSSEAGIIENSDSFFIKMINRVSDVIVNIFRAVPYIILLIWLIPLAKLLTGRMLGATAALPSLVVSATPFFARMVVIAFTEVDKGTIEASKAMGASLFTIIFKVLVAEALPALVSSACVTGINLVSYTAMAGAIGAGGLGFTAYNNGMVKVNKPVFYTAVVLIVAIVFIIQFIGDKASKKIDKR